MTMRALVLAPSLKRPGGIQRYTVMLVRALREHLGDDAVRMLTVERSEEKGSEKEQKLSGIAKVQFLVRAAREVARWHPDLTVCAHVGLSPVGWVLRILTRCPYWVIAYGIEVWGALPFWKRNALGSADRVISISNFTQDQLIARHRIPWTCITVLPCALDDRVLNIAPNGGRIAELGVHDRRVVLTVGRIAASERYKGHDVVLRALPRVISTIPNVTYLVVGDGDDRPRLERLAQQLGVHDHVVFTGYVTDAELAACYRACEVFILLAQTVVGDNAPKGEGFGIVFLEAMAFSRPVIGPNYGAPVEFIRHGEHGVLVNSEDPEAAALALIELLALPERTRQMGEAARQWVLKEYSYWRFLRRLRQLLSDNISTMS